MAQEARANSHIRILLDTSASMAGYRNNPATDPDKLSVLSAMMFFDLIKTEQLNIGEGDTFKILPFDYNYTTGQATKNSPATRTAQRPYWYQSDNEIATSEVEFIEFSRPMELDQRNGRNQFFSSIKNLTRNSQATYFYPGLNRLINEINETSTGIQAERDIKTIILVTDGIANGDADRQYYPEIARRLHESRITLIILGFGETNNNLNELRSLITNQGIPVGRVSSAANTNDVMRVMMELFAQNYHYSIDVKTGNDGGTIQLHGQDQPQKIITLATHVGQDAVAYVLIHPSANRSEDQTFSNTISINNNPTTIASYHLREHDSPPNGDYTLRINSSSISNLELFVLKPATFTIELVDPTAPKGNSSEKRVIAGSSSLPAYVYSSSLMGGTPEQVFVLEYQGIYTNNDEVESEPQSARFNRIKTTIVRNLASSSQTTNDLVSKQGKVFNINTSFRDDGKIYSAELDTRMRHELSTARGTNAGNERFLLKVYPAIEIYAAQVFRLGKDSPLEEGKSECSESVELVSQKANLEEVIASLISHHNLSGIPLKAYLHSNNAAQLQTGLLSNAHFTLNGKKIGFGSTNSASFSGQKIDSEAELLTGPDQEGYKLCVTMGIPISKSNSAAVVDLQGLQLQFVIDIDPYADTSANSIGNVDIPIKPVEVAIKATPSQWSIWSLLILALIPLFMWWFLRYVPELDPDLRYRLFTAVTHGELNNFEAATPLAVILRLRAKHGMLDPNTKKPIGTIAPIKDGLYELLFKDGYSLSTNENVAGSEFVPEVGHPYLINIRGQQPKYLTLLYMSSSTQLSDSA